MDLLARIAIPIGIAIGIILVIDSISGLLGYFAGSCS